MDKKTAEILLNIHQFDSPIDAYENQLFKLRNFIFQNPVIPKILYSKQKKNAQLYDAINHFESVENPYITCDLNPIEGTNLFDKFLCYEANKSQIKQNLSKHLTSKNIEVGIHQLIQNLLLWSEALSDIDTSHAETIPLSKELDALSTHQLLASTNQDSSSFDDPKLLSEFKRIKELAKSLLT
ncbi:hypothetical protein N9335_01640 [Crocinitomicaceae bacterium]|nr:hypothetical protein [Crocinitomicaceae bacterium]